MSKEHGHEGDTSRIRESSSELASDDTGDAGLGASPLTRAKFLQFAAVGAVGGAVGLSGVPAALGASARRSMVARKAQAVTISTWADHPEWQEVYQAIIKMFEAQNPNITVQLTTFPGPDYQAKAQSAIVAKTLPDVPALYASQIPVALKQNEIVDLTKYVNLRADHVLSATDGVTQFGGKTLSVPYAAYSLGVFYQKPIFAKYGLTPPTTWTELTQTMTKLKAAGVTPFVIDGKDGSLGAFLYGLLVASAFGTPDSFTQISEGKARLDGPEGLAAMEYLYSMKPYFQDGFLGTDYATAKVEFALGKGAMIVGGSADYTGYLLTNKKLQAGAMAWPAAKTGGATVKLLGNELPFCVSASSAHLPEAISFAKFMVSKDVQQYVANHLALAVTSNVKGTGVAPTLSQLATAGKYTLEPWYELPALAPVWAEVSAQISGLFTNRYTPKQMAKLFQSKVQVGAHF